VPPLSRCVRFLSGMNRRARGRATNWESPEKKELVPALFSEKIFCFE
jgi:hypothetical protein